MRDNFVNWMEHNFNLSSNQADQLDKLPAELGQKLGTAISNYLMQDNVLQVQKDEKKDEDPDFTAFSFYGLDEWLDGGTEEEGTPFIYGLRTEMPSLIIYSSQFFELCFMMLATLAGPIFLA